MAAGCLSSHADQVKAEIEREVKHRGLDQCCKVKGVGCMGLCAAGPLVADKNNEKMFQGVTASDAAAIVDAVVDNKPVHEAIVLDSNLDFFKRQQKIVLENSGEIDPEKIEDYIARNGYEALFHALMNLKPLEVIEHVTKSGIRGRGGAGFPTGLKWTAVAKATGAHKYVICNADEGDPGAFMDRSVLESDPHRVLEGMAIAAYAVGADRGYIYCRAEYPLAVKRLRTAIKQAEQHGLLGQNIGETHFDFKVEVRLGAGAFVCGEETALIASVEGGRGTPRPRPPFPAQAGLWGEPTLINNVETFANIAPIIRKGGDWYASIGTEKSKGTKVFALAGRVKNTGLIEVPMGISLRDIVFKLGGGIPDGRKFKAVQTGGPSGGCVPQQFLDMSVDYESLASVGAIIGSGGMIVMDETSCMVDVAQFFMDFCASESCGKCVPCRVGTKQMLGILKRIVNGEGSEEELAMLTELAQMVKSSSLCGLGQTTPNPISTTLRYFMDEYQAHIHDKQCPSGVCMQKKAAEVGA
ncbi:MAG TPA: NADH-quinone oxidoreductase subunit NuoF [candidate division Zixibacteria bacterium]|nr:NADH-quinone oxidoreductase subunit NuoF [candidate division Zixibacteria bacterium]